MFDQSGTYERQLVGFANHIDGQGGATRLVYDDHHAGDQLALIVAASDGLVELQVWRLAKGALVHVLATSPALAQRLGDWARSWHGALGWQARRTRSLAERIQKLASDLVVTHAQRSAGFPEPPRAQLAQLFPHHQIAVGVAGQHGGRGSSPMGVDAAGLRDTLWGVVVPVETEGAGPTQRVLLFDPGAQGFVAPREVRVQLTRSYDLATLGHSWRGWGLAGQAPSMVEQPLAPVARRRDDGRDADEAETCLGCALEEWLFCDLYLCEAAACMPDLAVSNLSTPDCSLPDCSLPDCDGVDCVPCDF